MRPLKFHKISHHVANSIKERILVGELQENSTLPPIKQLAQQLGISPGSLREALRILEDDGFLVMKTGPGGGPVVRHPRDEKVTEIVADILQLKKTKLRDLHEVRYYLELPSARIAAANRTDKDFQQLRASVQATRVANNHPEFLGHAVDFHQIIAGCAQNRILKLFFGCLHDLLYAAYLRVDFDASARAAVADDHERISEAIRDQDEGRAETLMREHLDRFESVLSEWFEQYMEKLF